MTDISTNQDARIDQLVRHYFRDLEINCATTTIKILGECFDLEVSPQTLDSTLGLNGAGQHGAQCGLAEGGLMFLGMIGRVRGIADDEIVAACDRYATEFEREFGSMTCSVLRPEGFKEDNPPHICEPISCRAVKFSYRFVKRFLRDE